MKIRYVALVLTLLAAPAFAQSIELPRLTWPTEPAAPVTQGCIDPAQVATEADCTGK